MATGDLKAYMQSVRLKLGQVKHFQFMQGADMSRVSRESTRLCTDVISSQDTHNVMRTIEKLDTWALIHMSIMVIIGLTQVIGYLLIYRFSL